MRNSSTLQKSNLEDGTEYQSDNIIHQASSQDDFGDTQISFPSFQSGSAYVAASREAGRLNAASVSEEEHRALLVERQSLLDRKFSSLATRAELNRLEYVRWSLDRIEDAKHGKSLDMLDGAISSYERFLEDIKALHSQLEEKRTGG